LSLNVQIEIGGEAIIDPSAAGVRLSRVELDHIENDLARASACRCPACDGARFARIARHDRYGFALDYVVCEGCGLLFANPYYDQDSLDRFYTRHYAAVYGRNAHPEAGFRAELQRGRVVRQLVEKSATESAFKYSSVLDLGCSHGGFLAAFPDQWQRVGYDYDEGLFVIGRARGIELNSILKLDGESRKFDVVMANQVVEHTRDPVGFLRRLASLLSENGVIYVEVPGLRSPAVSGIDYRLMFKNAHCFLFEGSTFELCAAKAGLRCEYLDESVRALLRPGAPPRRADAEVAHSPALRTSVFVRDKVARWRAPTVLTRAIGLPRRIGGFIARHLSSRD
jgi:SAM-dependent methyltransferase